MFCIFLDADKMLICYHYCRQTHVRVWNCVCRQAGAEADFDKDDGPSTPGRDAVASLKSANQTTSAQEATEQRAAERASHPVLPRYLLLFYSRCLRK